MILETNMSLLTIKDEPTAPLFSSYEIPKEVVTNVFFQYVTGAEWGALLLTSKSWCKIAIDPKSWKILFDREGLRYFDEVKCRKYRGEPGPVPYISLPRAYGYFNSDDKLFPGMKVKETHKLQLFYKEIDKKAITLNYAGTLAQNPKEGSKGIAACFHKQSWPKAFEVHGEAPLGESFWAFVTVELLEENSKILLNEKLQFVAEHPQYCLHRVVERSMANFDNVVETGEYLDGSSSITICEETGKHDFGKGEQDYQLAMGRARASGGLRVDNSIHLYSSFGVALLRKF